MFDGSDFIVPKGEFEINDAKIMNHILYKAQRWDFDVQQILGTEGPVIKQEVKKEEVVKTPVGGASTETLPKVEGKAKKDAK